MCTLFIVGIFSNPDITVIGEGRACLEKCMILFDEMLQPDLI